MSLTSEVLARNCLTRPMPSSHQLPTKFSTSNSFIPLDSNNLIQHYLIITSADLKAHDQFPLPASTHHVIHQRTLHRHPSSPSSISPHQTPSPLLPIPPKRCLTRIQSRFLRSHSRRLRSPSSHNPNPPHPFPK